MYAIQYVQRIGGRRQEVNKPQSTVSLHTGGFVKLAYDICQDPHQQQRGYERQGAIKDHY